MNLKNEETHKRKLSTTIKRLTTDEFGNMNLRKEYIKLRSSLLSNFNLNDRLKDFLNDCETPEDVYDFIDSQAITTPEKRILIDWYFENNNKSQHYVMFSRPEFMVEFPDSRLFRIIEHEGKKTETTYFEFKKDLSRKKNIETSELIGSIANTDSGILIFGWDEENNRFNDVDVEEIEQKIVQWNSSLIEPSLPIEIVKIFQKGIRILLVLIPAELEPRSVKGRFPKRVGSHKYNLTGKEIREFSAKRKKIGSGHLYLKYLHQLSEIKNENLPVSLKQSKIYSDIKKIVYAKKRTKESLTLEEWNSLKSLTKDQIEKNLTKRVCQWLVYYLPEHERFVRSLILNDELRNTRTDSENNNHKSKKIDYEN
ncbi:MAG: hypothetical protein HeimC3_32400 [Candidatus Heimdallarchaeota archaeon LC_3]|nr:MAG: hypothetical protein HeimC3_32400 [Candidatus Heimdallarchaeota archaeon LC_3]